MSRIEISVNDGSIYTFFSNLNVNWDHDRKINTERTVSGGFSNTLNSDCMSSNESCGAV